MDLVPATVAERLIGLSRREGLWRGCLIGGCAGFLIGAACAVLVIRGVIQ